MNLAISSLVSLWIVSGICLPPGINSAICDLILLTWGIILLYERFDSLLVAKYPPCFSTVCAQEIRLSPTLLNFSIFAANVLIALWVIQITLPFSLDLAEASISLSRIVSQISLASSLVHEERIWTDSDVFGRLPILSAIHWSFS